jgi:GDP-L-fucose synthase
MNKSDNLNYRGPFRQYDADGHPYLYKIGDVVEIKGKRYVATKPTSSKIPGTIDGNVVWKSDKPDGQLKKPSSNKRLLNIIGEYNFTPLEKGIKKSVDWFVKNYPNVRK